MKKINMNRLVISIEDDSHQNPPKNNKKENRKIKKQADMNS